MHIRLPGPAKDLQYRLRQGALPPQYIKILLVVWCLINVSITGIPQLRASAQAPLIPQTSSVAITRLSTGTNGETQDEPSHHITVIGISEGKRVATPTPRMPSATHTGTVASVQTKAASGTVQSILEALNTYRQSNSKSPLAWDDKLAGFAQQRADLFTSQGSMDSHAGFRDFINNQDGFAKLGFYQLGENSGLGHQIDGATLIKAYSESSAHNDNMLSSDWTHVGIGIAGSASNFVFGGSKR